MPLAQAKDSLLNLKDFATQHTDSSSRYSQSDTSTVSDNRNNGANSNQNPPLPLVRLDSSCSEESWVVEDYFRYWVLGNSDLEYHTELVPLVPETGVYNTKPADINPLFYDNPTTTTNHRPKARSAKEKRSCFVLFTFCNTPTSDGYSDDETDEEDASLVSTEGSSSTESAHKSSTRRHGGILKSASMAVQLVEGINVGERVTFQPTCFEPRVPYSHSSRKKHVHFSPLKSVVSICPLDCMTSKERKSVWWQAADFDHFKNSITILSKQKEEEKSCNTWLVWSRASLTTKSSGKAYKASNSSKGKASISYKAALTGTKSPNKKVVKTTVRQRKKTTSVNEKSAWWHKYGDSRRGLEKYASAMQAKQSMEVYKEAIHRVFDEQKNQKSIWSNRPDDEELARVYREYTGWARDLALAAAASDADALRTGFDDSKRKSREYFLLKQVYLNGMKIHRHIPAFMIPTGVQPKGFLDEHLSNCRSHKEK
mmetsp:Transcript_57791/g.67461  ORF Transcript_57791/g.67461 Transcript_57791/m.67461 type:complete len:483 (-) Transcript_57791:175-1623(-)